MSYIMRCAIQLKDILSSCGTLYKSSPLPNGGQKLIRTTVQVACLLQLVASPLPIHFVVGPTNTLCDQHLTWQPLCCSSANQVDGKFCQRYQGYFDSNVRVGFLVYRLLEHPILSIPIPRGEIRQVSSRNMESSRRWDTRFCTQHSSFWFYHFVVSERDTDQQLLYHSHLRPDCSPLPLPHSSSTATSICCQTRRGTLPSSSHKYPSSSMAYPTGLTFRSQLLQILYRHQPPPSG